MLFVKPKLAIYKVILTMSIINSKTKYIIGHYLANFATEKTEFFKKVFKPMVWNLIL